MLTEATHLLSRAQGGRQRCLEFFLEGGAALAPPNDAMLRRCHQLIEKYADVPMDYADATLVALAEELDTDLIFTTDGDFQVYRARRNRPFRIVPDL